jgi:hypothetical protein
MVKTVIRNLFKKTAPVSGFFVSTFRIKVAWNCVPALFISSPLPYRIIGICLGPVVLVRRPYLDHAPTIIHEMVHVEQFWRNGTAIHFVRYWLSKNYRLNCELEAFSREIRSLAPEAIINATTEAALSIATGYGLKISKNDAFKLLVERLAKPVD